MNVKVAIRDAYGMALKELGGRNPDVVVLDADVSNSSKSILFGKEYPERFYNVGVAEANMAGMAAGMSTTGKIPFVNTFAAFMLLRAADPIRSLACYGNLNVKFAGTYAGLSDSYDGATHHTLTDIAFMRAVPRMTVVSVCDPVETKKAVDAIAEYDGPVYLRLSRAAMPTIFDEGYDFTLGKGAVVKEGTDVTVIATGYMVHKALEAAEQLEDVGISVRVVNMHTIKPLDKELVVRCARETKGIVTVEEHSIYGGLGSAVAEVVGSTARVPVEIIGVQDTFTESGDYETLLEKYGLSAEAIRQKVLQMARYA
ncbi:transketolase family protein [Anaerotalea alkaliphila]|uniref:Transketolase family protein n=1 Tax=Anaerotalea alkaliphila TaxID=2662126 RepID=A0A7X5HY02_9FIRM|nr:transketolase family protein [Anaerotalea alkaliphila]NDL68743.1 transketolase family protein [Anaerotalea alkaliphila]